MVKRLLSASTSEVMTFDGQQLKESIKASEGRIIVSENIVTQENLDSITTAEIAAAFGADMILCNRLDVDDPKIFGLYPGKEIYTARLSMTAKRASRDCENWLADQLELILNRLATIPK
ncbi:hypothetical protein FAM18168_02640 [Lacticaseibacillus paracasei]|nr:hypothetical protein FAM18149_02810 [Lacticaseibacillus paracasei]RND81027.1 hypothetical protein FAM18168_02640 [Lacticaseibacillus paracasei]